MPAEITEDELVLRIVHLLYLLVCLPSEIALSLDTSASAKGAWLSLDLALSSLVHKCTHLS